MSCASCDEKSTVLLVCKHSLCEPCYAQTSSTSRCPGDKCVQFIQAVENPQESSETETTEEPLDEKVIEKKMDEIYNAITKVRKAYTFFNAEYKKYDAFIEQTKVNLQVHVDGIPSLRTRLLDAEKDTVKASLLLTELNQLGESVLKSYELSIDDYLVKREHLMRLSEKAKTAMLQCDFGAHAAICQQYDLHATMAPKAFDDAVWMCRNIDTNELFVTTKYRANELNSALPAHYSSDPTIQNLPQGGYIRYMNTYPSYHLIIKTDKTVTQSFKDFEVRMCVFDHETANLYFITPRCVHVFNLFERPNPMPKQPLYVNDNAGSSSKHPPIIDHTRGVLKLWSKEAEMYVDFELKK